MNLYKLHSKPESLSFYKEAYDSIPKIFWEKYENNPTEIRKRETAIAKDGWYSLKYAYFILKGPFPAAEAVIAKNAYYSYWYACHILNGPFPAGEAAIAKSEYKKAYDVLLAPLK